MDLNVNQPLLRQPREFDQACFDALFGSTIEDGINQHLNFSTATVALKDRPVTDLTNNPEEAHESVVDYVNSGFTFLLLTLFSLFTDKTISQLIANFSKRCIEDKTANRDAKIEAVVRKHLANKTIDFQKTSEGKINLAANSTLLRDSELKLFTVDQISTGLEATLVKVEQERQEAAQDRLGKVVQNFGNFLSRQARDYKLTEEEVSYITSQSRKAFPILNALETGVIIDALKAKHKEVIKQNVATFVYERFSRDDGSELRNATVVEAVQRAFTNNPPTTIFEGEAFTGVIETQRQKKRDEADKALEAQIVEFTNHIQNSNALKFANRGELIRRLQAPLNEVLPELPKTEINLENRNEIIVTEI
jgi:hypothetical protein